jgi:S-adenosylmethionine-diacylglycerol 3-amino-3-carboxypropyl transferase
MTLSGTVAHIYYSFCGGRRHAIFIFPQHAAHILGSYMTAKPIVKPQATLSEQFHEQLFNAIYSKALVYNTCWEDPAVDRQALAIAPHDNILVITSAGCNALDYALTTPNRIDAVDANPRQTALLELKIAGIRHLNFDDYFALFGDGRHPRFRELYQDALRGALSPFARAYWDRHGRWFMPSSSRGSFYFHSLSGLVARAFRGYLDLRPQLRAAVEELLEAKTLEQQREIYDRRAAPHMWSRGMNWALSRQFTMNMLGVPHTQHAEVRRQHADGVPGFVREAVEYVFRSLPLWTNYFWRLYLNGAYSADCCPEYLKRENFHALKMGLVDRVHPHTCTVTEFLRRAPHPISKFVLLDHMDWMSSLYPAALADEWSAIVERAAPGSRVIFRSAHADPSYLKSLLVPLDSGQRLLTDLLHFHPRLALDLTRQDRVHTYAGFHIADLAA